MKVEAERPCRGCHAEMLMVRTSAGRLMPLDKKRTQVWIVNPDGTVNPEPVWGHVTHFGTCPVADQFKKSKG